MTEAVFVRIALGVYALLTVIAITLIWKNAAASDALKNAGIAVASALPLLIAGPPISESRAHVSKGHNEESCTSARSVLLSQRSEEG
jgi:hypothetical protein